MTVTRGKRGHGTRKSDSQCVMEERSNGAAVIHAFPTLPSSTHKQRSGRSDSDGNSSRDEKRDACAKFLPHASVTCDARMARDSPVLEHIAGTAVPANREHRKRLSRG